MNIDKKVYRVFVEKKPDYAVEAKHILIDLQNNLQIQDLESLRLFNRYDVQGINDDEFAAAGKSIFAEPPVDYIYPTLPDVADAKVFAIQYLPGQFDQRADSCAQSIQLLTQKARPLVRSARIFLLEGNINDKQLAAIKKYLINPVEAEEASLELPATLVEEFSQPEIVEKLVGFLALDEARLANIIDE